MQSSLQGEIVAQPLSKREEPEVRMYRVPAGSRGSRDGILATVGGSPSGAGGEGDLIAY